MEEMSLNDIQATSRSRRLKKKHSKKRASEAGHCSKGHDEARRHKKSFSKILSSLLGKSKTNSIVLDDHSSIVKKSSNETKPPPSASPLPLQPLPEVNEHRKIKTTGDEYHHREKSQLHREPTSKPHDKIDFLKYVQLSNTNLQSNKKPKVKGYGKELIRPDSTATQTTSVQTYKNDSVNVKNAISRKKSKLKKAAKERDILSFFDTGYVTSNSVSDGVQINEIVQNDEVTYRSPLSTPETEDEPVPRMTTLKGHVDTNSANTYILKPAGRLAAEPARDSNANVFRFKKPPHKSISRTSRRKSWKTSRSNSTQPAIWYCKRIPEDRNEPCKDDNTLMAGKDSYQYTPYSTSPRHQAEALVKKYFPRQLSPQEKKYLTYAIGIILATAGIAAFFMFMSRPKSKHQPKTVKVADECCENEIEEECFPQKNDNCWGTEDDDACVYEKHQCVKCQNPNYKAVVSATEKLHEDDDVVCALQDLKKVTKRVKGNKRQCMKRCNNMNPREAAGGRCGEYFKGSECAQKCDFRGTDCTQPRCEDKCRSKCA